MANECGPEQNTRTAQQSYPVYQLVWDGHEFEPVALELPQSLSAQDSAASLPSQCDIEIMEVKIATLLDPSVPLTVIGYPCLQYILTQRRVPADFAATFGVTGIHETVEIHGKALTLIGVIPLPVKYRSGTAWIRHWVSSEDPSFPIVIGADTLPQLGFDLSCFQVSSDPMQSESYTELSGPSSSESEAIKRNSSPVVPEPLLSLDEVTPELIDSIDDKEVLRELLGRMIQTLDARRASTSSTPQFAEQACVRDTIQGDFALVPVKRAPRFFDTLSLLSRLPVSARKLVELPRVLPVVIPHQLRACPIQSSVVRPLLPTEEKASAATALRHVRSASQITVPKDLLPLPLSIPRVGRIIALASSAFHLTHSDVLSRASLTGPATARVRFETAPDQSIACLRRNKPSPTDLRRGIG
jgi:hypothetical protein